IGAISHERAGRASHELEQMIDLPLRGRIGIGEGYGRKPEADRGDECGQPASADNHAELGNGHRVATGAAADGSPDELHAAFSASTRICSVSCAFSAENSGDVLTV